MYQYTNPKMQEVAKLCEKGFWPICKNERGEYAIFSPVINGIDCLRKTDWVNSIKRAKEIIGATFHDNTHIQPTEIVGFYNPPRPKFEVGDKVRVREDLIEVLDMQLKNSFIAGKITEIGDIKQGIASVRIEGVYFDLPFNAFEPVLETEPKTVTFIIVKEAEELVQMEEVTKEQLAEINKILGK